MFLSPWEPLGRRLRSIPIPQFRIQNQSSKYNFRGIPPYLKSASYLHMRGIRVTSSGFRRQSRKQMGGAFRAHAPHEDVSS